MPTRSSRSLPQVQSDNVVPGREGPITRSARPSSILLPQQISELTGRPIRLAITGLSQLSHNEKTGPMVQTWIVPDGVNPSVALGTERERDVCGDCPCRGRGSTRPCYVATGIWHVARNLERYPEVGEAAALLVGRSVRLGAYGDPAALPFHVWANLLAGVRHWAGYTHQWRTCDERFQRICMASVETLEDQALASSRGWRTFRVRPPGGELQPDELLCLNEDRDVQCVDCKLCRGGERGPKNVVITVHGFGAAEWLRRFAA